MVHEERPGFALVQGPPGTGKSTLLLSLLNVLHNAATQDHFDRVLDAAMRRAAAPAAAAAAAAASEPDTTAPPPPPAGESRCATFRPESSATRGASARAPCRATMSALCRAA